MLHISPEITIYILTITFILGCCLGSFADCAAGRLLSGESVVAGRSHCDHCGHVLGVLDLIPLFSWLLLKGHCRYCRAKIPAEAFFVELASGIACCMIVYRYDMSVMSLRGNSSDSSPYDPQPDRPSWMDHPRPPADCGLCDIFSDRPVSPGPDPENLWRSLPWIDPRRGDASRISGL